MNHQALEPNQLKTDFPEFAAGDTVKVHVRIKEGDKVRVQMYEGVVIKRVNGKGSSGSFTVRRIASGIGVERTFMLHSPNVLKIDVIRLGKVRRAKLYYLRDLKTKRINIKQRRAAVKADTSTASVIEEAPEAVAEPPIAE